MNESISIAVTTLGIFIELLVVIGLARLVDAEIPKRTILVGTAVGLGIISLTIGGLIPGTSLAAYGILALVRWLNRRDNPGRQASGPDSRPAV
jgi:hypothetical protein